MSKIEVEIEAEGKTRVVVLDKDTAALLGALLADTTGPKVEELRDAAAERYGIERPTPQAAGQLFSLFYVADDAARGEFTPPEQVIRCAAGVAAMHALNDEEEAAKKAA